MTMKHPIIYIGLNEGVVEEALTNYKTKKTKMVAGKKIEDWIDGFFYYF